MSRIYGGNHRNGEGVGEVAMENVAECPTENNHSTLLINNFFSDILQYYKYFKIGQ